MATFNQIVSDLLTLRSSRDSLKTQVGQNSADISAKKDELIAKVLELNPIGGGGLPPNFLADGITIVKRNGLIFEIEYIYRPKTP